MERWQAPPAVDAAFLGQCHSRVWAQWAVRFTPGMENAVLAREVGPNREALGVLPAGVESKPTESRTEGIQEPRHRRRLAQPRRNPHLSRHTNRMLDLLIWGYHMIEYHCAHPI